MENEIEVIQHLVEVEHEASMMLQDAQKKADEMVSDARSKAEEKFKTLYAQFVKVQEVTEENERQKILEKKSMQLEDYVTHLSDCPKNQEKFNEFMNRVLGE